MEKFLGKPSKVRWYVFASLLALCTVNYVDRAVISICMPTIEEDLHFGPALVGIILSAFFWGYTLMQIPAGWFADHFGPGKTILGSGILWGIFQILTGTLSSSTAFMAVRALLGASEAPIYPASSKLQSVWLTKHERTRGAALVDCGSALGTSIGGPLIIAFLTWFGGWRGALIGAGVFTMLVVCICYKFVHTTPDTNKMINQEERDYIDNALKEEYESEQMASGGKTSIGLLRYLNSFTFWGMVIGFICYDCFWYGLMTWGPMYLSQSFHVNIMTVGGSIFIIFGCGAIGSLFGGSIVDYFNTKGYDSNKVVKYTLGSLGIVMAFFMFMLSEASSITMAIVYMSLAMFCEKWVGATFWMMPAVISQRDDVGIVAGAMNFMGNIGGAIVPIIVGIIVTATGGDYYWAIILFLIFALGVSVFPLMINMKKKVGAA
ncbi:MFS transporter [Megasphaera paucivorans]|uniref:MFS transporter, ACS family, D-galactonate transporter n=1 Tax=Megasphaera paucivorans TaxID=349095 RepID=A0A1G9XP01_9FIRM|nr:MFS transporter [Megasphaera paucivorans]SDM98517.1 MFS transporter, ACS family, D-galactonate transporter [Megasphaera paucivorans]